MESRELSIACAAAQKLCGVSSLQASQADATTAGAIRGAVFIGLMLLAGFFVIIRRVVKIRIAERRYRPDMRLNPALDLDLLSLLGAATLQQRLEELEEVDFVTRGRVNAGINPPLDRLRSGVTIIVSSTRMLWIRSENEFRVGICYVNLSEISTIQIHEGAHGLTVTAEVSEADLITMPVLLVKPNAEGSKRVLFDITTTNAGQLADRLSRVTDISTTPAPASVQPLPLQPAKARLLVERFIASPRYKIRGQRKGLVIGLRLIATFAPALVFEWLFATLPTTVDSLSYVFTLIIGLPLLAYIMLRVFRELLLFNRLDWRYIGPGVTMVTVAVFAFGYRTFSELGYFHGPQGDGATMDRVQAIYFSTVTLTTVGYGDYYPITNSARILVTIQIIVDLFLLAIILTAFATRFMAAVSAERAPKPSSWSRPTAS